MRQFLERFRSFDPRAVFKGAPLTLTQALGVSWWAMLITGLVLFSADGLLFYRYGLGHAPLAETTDSSPAIRVREDVLKGAAAALHVHQAEFAATTTLPADFPNPFR
ncbi:MAG: hypothetical protein A3A44_01285 [Candidatus Sungbacteria bacterium RIFCSPLOWO2_01_FULL_60_25]|uniref:Uncharacterized protein n=1 Tax=Candidatus Sungbacteria bacterium RIFCSPLOWO2_01_FULL_60_25 TaxID=1802281 RepID=A0A1G2LEF0_9BACT|nr:MAG: hypothetical protein A3A44_01285 [Candidatus Sungbacteria bacterium RIFCSPLOWO2_01_FULL_60_25]